MLVVYDQLCAACGAELYGNAIMGGGLVLAAHPHVELDEGVILIYFDPKEFRFSLHYRNREVEPEQLEHCSVEDIWHRLRLYLSYKFGIRINEPNPTA